MSASPPNAEQVNRARAQPLVKPSVPAIDPDFVHQFGEVLVRRKDEIALENSSEAGDLAAVVGKITATINELSTAAADITGKMNGVLAKGNIEPVVTDEKLRPPQQLEGGQAIQGDGVAEVILRGIDPHDLACHKAQIAEAKTTALSVEKKQESVKRQEPSKQRQQKQDKKRDQGMEL